MPTHVLGINAYDHDVSACLLRDGRVVAAIAKERLSRLKHDTGFYDQAVDYVLAEGGIGLDDVDLTVLNSYMLPVPELEEELLVANDPVRLHPEERERATSHPLFLSRDDRTALCSHHLAHAYSAFAASPFPEGAVMVVDGIGSYRGDVTEEVPAADQAHEAAREAESYYRFEGDRIETVRKVWAGPFRAWLGDEFFALPGIGARYSRVSMHVFGHWNLCGEVMGLAPYGRPTMPRLFEVRDGDLVVHPWPERARRPNLGLSDREWQDHPARRDWEDLAFRVQADTEEALLARARWLHEETGAKNLVMAGGVALNCVANARILEETPFERVFVQPAAGDDGVALGCALYGHLALLGGKRSWVMESAALGRRYDDADIDAALAPAWVRALTRRRKLPDVAGSAARLLADGRVVGWLQGRSEFGPRALGHRSILADPRSGAMKDLVNARVKHRQGFRPFAPSVPAERAAEFFEGEAESPFMVLVKRVRPEARSRIPAVVHVDGTARVHTVRKEADPLFHELLTAFGRITGVPVLLNTSFNVRGRPMVETPGDALSCFLRTRLDALVLHDRLIEKTLPGRGISTVARAFKSDTLRERLGRALLREA